MCLRIEGLVDNEVSIHAKKNIRFGSERLAVEATMDEYVLNQGLTPGRKIGEKRKRRSQRRRTSVRID